MSFQQNFTKSSIFAVKLVFSVVLWLEFSEISLKIPQISLSRLHLALCISEIFPKNTLKYTKIAQFYVTWNGSQQNFAKITPSFTIKIPHYASKAKVLLHIYVSFQG